MIYCVSDIHGEYDMMRRLLDEVRFDDHDTLIVGGDIIDKGRQSIALANFIFSLENPICLMGNHEHAFLKKYHALASDDGADFDKILDELKTQFVDGELLTWDTIDNFESMLSYYDGGYFLCVHAGVPLDLRGNVKSLDDVPIEFFVNDRAFKEPETVVNTDKCILFGHTPTCAVNNYYKIIKYPRQSHLSDSPSIKDYSRVHLDTGVYITDMLGCFCVDNCKSYYVKRN